MKLNKNLRDLVETKYKLWAQGGLGFKDFNHMNLSLFEDKRPNSLGSLLFIIHQVSEFTMIETQGQLSASTKIIGGAFGNRRRPPREGVFNINLDASFIPLLVAFKGVLL